VLEYSVAADDAIVGARVRDLGLPRDAILSVIVRGDRAIPPRGSTRLESGDELHVLAGEESAPFVRRLIGRWHTGPVGPPPRPPRPITGRRPVFSVWRWDGERDGDRAFPHAVRGQTVIELLRVRRDTVGSLCVLADGRYVVTGRIAAIGSAEDLADWARRRMRVAQPDEAAWLQTVIGALAADTSDAASRAARPGG
jgi:cell volume regulation protein A